MTGQIPLGEIFREASTSDEVRELDKLDIEERQANIEDRRTDTRLKKKYANSFFWLLVAQLIVMNLVLISVGLGYLNYTEIALNLYMGGTLAEVFGVVLVITRYLFSKKHQ